MSEALVVALQELTDAIREDREVRARELVVLRELVAELRGKPKRVRKARGPRPPDREPSKEALALVDERLGRAGYSVR